MAARAQTAAGPAEGSPRAARASQGQGQGQGRRRRRLRRLLWLLVPLLVVPAAGIALFGAATLPPLPLPPPRDAEITGLVAGEPVTLVLREGRIAARRPAAAAPGLPALLPGLIDAHVHSPFLPGDQALWDTLYLLHGITSVRHLGDGNRSLARKAGPPAAGPRLFSCGVHIDGPPAVPFIARSVATPDEARAVVADQVRRGADCIKVFSHLSAESYWALHEAAHGAGLPVVGHMVSAVGIEAARMDDVQHLTGVPEGPSPGFGDEEFGRFHRAFDGLTEARLAAVIAAARRDGTTHTPTLVGAAYLAHALGPPALHLLPPWYGALWGELDRRVSPEDRAQAVRNLPRYLDIVGRLHGAGVPIQAGSDVFPFIPDVVPGAGLHDELRLLVRAGLPVAEAVRSATEVPARLLRTSGLGTLAVGAPADLGVYGKDPSQDLAHLATLAEVYVGGRRYTTLDLRQHLRRQLDAAARPPYTWAARLFLFFSTR